MHSKILTVSRLLLRGTCQRADHLRHEDELAPIGIACEAEPLSRGGVIHAGLAAACARFPAPPDPATMAAACAEEAVGRGLSAGDPRIALWNRVAVRAAWATGPESWEPVRLTVASDGSGCGDGSGSDDNPTAGRLDGDDTYEPGPSAYVDGQLQDPPGLTVWRSERGVAWGLTRAAGRRLVLGEVTDPEPSRQAVTWIAALRAAWAWYDRRHPLLVERRLVVPLPDGDPRYGSLARGWGFSFKPDAVLRRRAVVDGDDPGGAIDGDGTRTWLWDHKTKASIARVEPWTELHLQSLLYVRALRELGVHVDGAVLYTILADEPTVPTLRKDGHLRETAWATDWPTACEVIRRSADPDPDSPRYDTLRASCTKRVWQLAQEVQFDETELDAAWSHLLDARDELVRARADAEQKALDVHMPLWRALHPSGRGRACESCDYRRWCGEDFAGREPERMIGDSYKRGPDKYLAEVALTAGRDDLYFVAHDDFRGIDTGRAR